MTGIVKHYEDMSAADAVSAILTDIAHSGSSYSWSTNDLSVLEDMKKRLSKFNVHYVSDFDGRWEYVEPQQNTCVTPKFKPSQKVYWYDGNSDGGAVAEVVRIVIDASGISYELADNQHSMYFTLSESALFESPADVYDRRIALIRKDIQLLENDIAILEKEKRKAGERGKDE